MSDRIILKSRQVARSRGRLSGNLKTIEFDRDRRVATKNGHLLGRLTPQEALTLDLLIRKAPHVVTNEELQRTLWPDTEVGDPQQRVRDIVADLRTTLGDSAKAPCFIETTSGAGYSFVGTIEACEDNLVPPQPISQPLESASLPAASVSPPEPFHNRSFRRFKLLTATESAIGGVTVLLLIAALLYVYGRIHRPVAEATTQPERASPSGSKASVPRFGRLFAQATSEGRTTTGLNIGYEIGWLLATPDGSTLYAIEKIGRRVTEIDVNDLRITQTFQLPNTARGAAMSRDGKRIYVGSPDAVVMIVDSKRGIVERSIPTVNPVFELTVTPDEEKLFLAMGDKGLDRILIASGEETVLSEFACPLFVDLDKSGRRLFVTYQCGGPSGSDGHDVVEVYDSATEERIGLIRDLPMVGRRPAVSPRGDFILLDASDACITARYDHIGCPSAPGHVFYLVRVSDRTVVKSFSRPKETWGAAFSPDGSRVIFGGYRLVVVDWARDMETEVLPLNGAYSSIFAFSTSRTFVASSLKSMELLVFDGAELGCGQHPGRIANQYSGYGTFDDSVGVSALKAVGDVYFGPGLFGQAFKFDGTGAFLEGAGGGACWPCEGNWTESFFAKFESVDGEMTLLDRESGSSFRWRHRIFKANDNRIKVELGSPSTNVSLSSSASVKLGKWYHIAVVADGLRRIFYLDGAPQGQVELVGPDSERSNRGVVTLGASRNKVAAFSGLLDEITWHEQALSAREAMALAQPRNGSTCRP